MGDHVGILGVVLFGLLANRESRVISFLDGFVFFFVVMVHDETNDGWMDGWMDGG